MIALRFRTFLRSPRTTFIVRVGIGRVGIPLGTAVFVWLLVIEYNSLLQKLHTVQGWISLLGLAALCVAEWVVGAGWLIGSVLWLGQRPSKRERDRNR